jgi:hypothetical protein
MITSYLLEQHKWAKTGHKETRLAVPPSANTLLVTSPLKTGKHFAGREYSYNYIGIISQERRGLPLLPAHTGRSPCGVYHYTDASS